MALQHLAERAVHGVPGVVGGPLDVGRTLAHGVLVVAVERRSVDNPDGQLLCMAHHKRRVGLLQACSLVGHGTQDGAEVHLLLLVAQGVARHHDLPRRPVCRRHLHPMGHQRPHQQLLAERAAAGRETDGDGLVGMAHEVFFPDLHVAAAVLIHDDGTVERQLTIVAGPCPLVERAQAQRAQRHVVAAVGALYAQLQGVGSLIVFLPQSLANLGQPLMGIAVHLAVVGTARPERDVVQLHDVLVGMAIHQCAQSAVSHGQRLLKVLRRLVVPQPHRQLTGGC